MTEKNIGWCQDMVYADDGTALICTEPEGHEERSLNHVDRYEGYIWNGHDKPKKVR